MDNITLFNLSLDKGGYTGLTDCIMQLIYVAFFWGGREYDCDLRTNHNIKSSRHSIEQTEINKSAPCNLHYALDYIVLI